MKIFCFFLFLFASCDTFGNEESFLLLEGESGETIASLGAYNDKQATPCSTFKIVLCLLGFESGILENLDSPIWEYQEGFANDLECWKQPHSPKTWIEHSCVWYSQILIKQLGSLEVQSVLEKIEYGNQDLSGGLSRAWLSSSLKISPMQQFRFIREFYKGNLPVSKFACDITKTLLYKEKLENGWQLFGKTGLGSLDGGQSVVGWFVGWIEKNSTFYPFCYQIRGNKIDPTSRVDRVKTLLNPIRRK